MKKRRVRKVLVTFIAKELKGEGETKDAGAKPGKIMQRDVRVKSRQM